MSFYFCLKLNNPNILNTLGSFRIITMSLFERSFGVIRLSQRVTSSTCVNCEHEIMGKQTIPLIPTHSGGFRFDNPRLYRAGGGGEKARTRTPTDSPRSGEAAHPSEYCYTGGA